MGRHQASFGTGQPMRFLCQVYRRSRPSRREPEHRLTYWYRHPHECVRTGRERPLNDGAAQGRSMDRRVEYRCLTCGHVGWSRHVEAARLPLEGADG